MSPAGCSLHVSIKAELHTRYILLLLRKFAIPRQPSMSKTEGLRIAV